MCVLWEACAKWECVSHYEASKRLHVHTYTYLIGFKNRNKQVKTTTTLIHTRMNRTKKNKKALRWRSQTFEAVGHGRERETCALMNACSNVYFLSCTCENIMDTCARGGFSLNVHACIVWRVWTDASTEVCAAYWWFVHASCSHAVCFPCTCVMRICLAWMCMRACGAPQLVYVSVCGACGLMFRAFRATDRYTSRFPRTGYPLKTVPNLVIWYTRAQTVRNKGCRFQLISIRAFLHMLRHRRHTDAPAKHRRRYT